MDSTILASIITGAVAIIVCMINNHFQSIKQAKAHNDNIVLISYRLEQLEQKVDKHNNLIDRTYELERRADVIEEKQKVANNRISDLERHGHEDDGR
jgi:hypothetical protein